jgi:hypothetical protein
MATLFIVSIVLVVLMACAFTYVFAAILRMPDNL